MGLVYDFCVGSTAVDAAKLGIETYIVVDATKSESPATEEKMKLRCDAAGVKEV